LFSFAVTATSWGPSVTSINGIIADTSSNQYWSLKNGLSGKPLTAGVGQYRPEDQEEILFKLSSY